MKRRIANLLTGLLVWTATTFAVAAEPMTVGVSLLPQQTFVERIGGKQVRVVVLVPPGKSPATHEPTPQQIEEVAASRLYFRIGVPFENTWVPNIRQAHPKLTIVDTRQGIELQPMGGHDHDHDHKKTQDLPIVFV